MLLAALLRLPSLGTQSFWYDEAVTVHRVLHPSLGATLSIVPRSESNPPLYYLLAWVWTRAFGTSEVGIRSLSALAGIATVPVVWATARRLVGTPAAWLAAGIVAVNPFLVWYSQEARPYALVTLLAAASLYWWVRVPEEPSKRALGWWAVFSLLAICTHYFAGFLVGAEAVGLLLLRRDRRVMTAVAAVGAGVLALAPLALHQAASDHTNWIAAMSLPSRLLATPEKFALGETATRVRPLLGAAALILAVLTVRLAVTTRSELRRSARVPLLLAAACLGVPLLLVLAGQDYIWPRNLIVALLPLSIVGGVALATPRRWQMTATLAGLLGLLSIAAVVVVDVRPRLQRADWRDLAPVIGRAAETRAIVVPFIGDEPLEFYLPHTSAFPQIVSRQVREVVLVGWSPARYRGQLSGFQLVGQRRSGLFTVALLRATQLQKVDRHELAAHPLDRVRVRVLLQTPESP